MPNRVLMIRLTQAQFDALASKDSNALYFTADSHRIYKGAECYSLEQRPILDPGGGLPGQVLTKTETGYGWSWAVPTQAGNELMLLLELEEELATATTGQNIVATGIPEFVYDDTLQRYCIQLNGSNFLTLSTLGLPVGAHARTLAVWAKSDVAVTSNKCIFSYGSQGSNKTFGISFLPEKSVGVVGGGGTAFQTSPGINAFDQTVWNHFVVTNDGVIEKLYINGILTVTNNMLRDTGEAYCRLGTWITGTSSSDKFVGRISDLRLYNGVLSAEEITNLATP